MDRRVGQILVVKPRFTNTAAGVQKGQEAFVNLTDGNYSSDFQNQTAGVGDGVTTVFSGNTSLTPVRPATFQVLVDGVVVAVDNGNGGLSGVGVSGTVSYQSGAYSVTFATAPTAGQNITLGYRWDVEQNPVGIRQLELGMNLLPIQATPHPLQVKFSVEAALAAEAEYNFDVQQNSVELVAFFIKAERDRQVTSLIANAATPAPTLDFSCTPPSPEITRRQHFQDFSLKLVEADNQIFDANKRGRTSFVLCGRNARAVIELQADFVKEKNDVPVGAYKAGTWKGYVDVIFDPSLDANTYIFGFRGMVLGDAALILGEWIPLYLTPIFQSPDLINTQGLLSMYGTLLNNQKYYFKGTLSGYVA